MTFNNLGEMLAAFAVTLLVGYALGISSLVIIVRFLRNNDLYTNALEKAYMSLPLTPETRDLVQRLLGNVGEVVDYAEEITDGSLRGDEPPAAVPTPRPPAIPAP